MSPFNRLDTFLPFLTARGGRRRADRPRRHPPRSRPGRASDRAQCGARDARAVRALPGAHGSSADEWWLALAALVVGVLATVSRTGIVMLLVVGLVYLWLRPREIVRLWPLLMPVLVVTHFAAPGTLGSLKQAFLPEGGLIGQQSTTEFGCDSSGRIADIGPTLAEVSQTPFLGHGFGTRVVTGTEANACVLDNQWLGTLVDVGAARHVRLAGALPRRPPPLRPACEDGLLARRLAARRRRGCVDRLRRRDADLRRPRLHPGYVPPLRPARARRRRGASAAASETAGSGRGSSPGRGAPARTRSGGRDAPGGPPG